MLLITKAASLVRPHERSPAALESGLDTWHYDVLLLLFIIGPPHFPVTVPLLCRLTWLPGPSRKATFRLARALMPAEPRYTSRCWGPTPSVLLSARICSALPGLKRLAPAPQCPSCREGPRGYSLHYEAGYIHSVGPGLHKQRIGARWWPHQVQGTLPAMRMWDEIQVCGMRSRCLTLFLGMTAQRRDRGPAPQAT